LKGLQMKVSPTLALALLTLLTWSGIASAQQSSASSAWQKLTNSPTFDADTALQLTDGTIMVHQYSSTNWWRLTPSATGSYLAGTWTQLASMPDSYEPLYFASAVLADGTVVVEGGEYDGNQTETNQGATYNPTTNTWTTITAPTGWSHIGDAQSVVLANDTFMLGNCGYAGSICSPFQLEQALLNESALTWTITGAGKADQNSEEGWTLLPSGEVLVVDMDNGTESELYNPTTGTWSLAGSTIAPLPETACYEIGPAVLQPNGNVFAIGGNNNTAIYNTTTATWSAGPTFPTGYGVEDGPAALLPNGDVLVGAAPTSPCYASGTKYYVFNGTTLTLVSSPQGASSNPAYTGRMLVLPTGQVLFTNGTSTVQVYTATGTYEAAWQPTVTSVAKTLTAGSTANLIEGTQLNGLSQGAMYGDDAQMASNYPLVRIVNPTTKDVYYCRTHNHSTMGVATGTAIVSTTFDVPSTVPAGSAELYVVANGIPSKPVKVSITQ
jgi:hypothetical protein